MRLPTGNRTERNDRKASREAGFDNSKRLMMNWNKEWERHVLEDRSSVYRDLNVLYESTGDPAFSKAKHSLYVHGLDMKNWERKLHVNRQLAAEALEKCLAYRSASVSEAAEMVVREIAPFPNAQSFDAAVKSVKNSYGEWPVSSRLSQVSRVWFVAPIKGAIGAPLLIDPFSQLTLKPDGMLVRTDAFWQWASDIGWVSIDPEPSLPKLKAS